MASMLVVQPKQPSFSVLPSSLSDFNGIRLSTSVKYQRKVWKPRGALHVSASVAKKILIMGGTRFIGIFLSRLLVKEGHQVTLFTRGKAPITQQLPGESDADYVDFSSKILHLKGDRKDFEFVKSSLAAEGFDVVYDINGREAVEVEPIIDALPNLEQYIYCSSAGVYLKSDYLPHFETDAVDPKSRHKGKLETESLLEARGVNYTSIRPVYIYGPLNYNPVEEWFFHRLKAGRPIPIPNSGIQVTQLGHVKDLATAFIKVLGNEKASKQVFNISGEKYVTFAGLAKACAKAGGFPVPELDPSCHRDRGSVLASLGSENELVKCLECSERGRKVIGIMGKRNSDSKIESEVVTFESDIYSNNAVAEMTEEKMSNSSAGANGSNNNDNSSNDTAKDLENGSPEMDKIEESKVEVKNENQDADIAKKSEFCYGEEERERFNRILKCFQGTHNFHNFTTRTKAEDPAARRYIISFEANTTVTVEGIEFVKCEVVGQSFMLHQIRKMIGLAVAIMRNSAYESLIEAAFRQDVNINVPMAPEVGLYLDECFFSSYNQKWKDSHEELSMKSYAEEAEDFKMQYIYSHIASTEHKEGVVALWLHSLNYRNYPDLCFASNSNNTDGESLEVDNIGG